MKYTRLIYMSGIVLMLLSACSDSSSLDAEGQNGKPLQQTFTVAVESVGELFEGGEGVRLLSHHAVLFRALHLRRRSTSSVY